MRGLRSVEEWEKSLPRGCRRTLAKALDQSFTVVGRPIRGGEPAPHSSLAHFRCVAEHEVRLLADSPTAVLDALSQAVGRYVGCTPTSFTHPTSFTLPNSDPPYPLKVRRLHVAGRRDPRV